MITQHRVTGVVLITSVALLVGCGGGTRQPSEAAMARAKAEEPAKQAPTAEPPSAPNAKPIQIHVSNGLTVTRLSSLAGKAVIVPKPETNQTDVTWLNGTLSATFDGATKRAESLNYLISITAYAPLRGSINDIALGQELTPQQRIDLNERMATSGPGFIEYSVLDKYWRTSVTVVDGRVHSVIMTRNSYANIPRRN